MNTAVSSVITTTGARYTVGDWVEKLKKLKLTLGTV